MIRSQDTCSLSKSDDSWVWELAFFIAVFFAFSPSAVAEGLFLLNEARVTSRLRGMTERVMTAKSMPRSKSCGSAL